MESLHSKKNICPSSQSHFMTYPPKNCRTSLHDLFQSFKSANALPIERPQFLKLLSQDSTGASVHSDEDMDSPVLVSVTGVRKDSFEPTPLLYCEQKQQGIVGNSQIIKKINTFFPKGVEMSAQHSKFIHNMTLPTSKSLPDMKFAQQALNNDTGVGNIKVLTSKMSSSKNYSETPRLVKKQDGLEEGTNYHRVHGIDKHLGYNQSSKSEETSMKHPPRTLWHNVKGNMSNKPIMRDRCRRQIHQKAAKAHENSAGTTRNIAGLPQQHCLDSENIGSFQSWLDQRMHRSQPPEKHQQAVIVNCSYAEAVKTTRQPFCNKFNASTNSDAMHRKTGHSVIQHNVCKDKPDIEPINYHLRGKFYFNEMNNSMHGVFRHYAEKNKKAIFARSPSYDQQDKLRYKENFKQRKPLLNCDHEPNIPQYASSPSCQYSETYKRGTYRISSERGHHQTEHPNLHSQASHLKANDCFECRAALSRKITRAHVNSNFAPSTTVAITTCTRPNGNSTVSISHICSDVGNASTKSISSPIPVPVITIVSADNSTPVTQHVLREAELPADKSNVNKAPNRINAQHVLSERRPYKKKAKARSAKKRWRQKVQQGKIPTLDFATVECSKAQQDPQSGSPKTIKVQVVDGSANNSDFVVSFEDSSGDNAADKNETEEAASCINATISFILGGGSSESDSDIDSFEDDDSGVEYDEDLWDSFARTPGYLLGACNTAIPRSSSSPDISALSAINELWNKNYKYENKMPGTGKSVRFAEGTALIDVHPIIAWSHAYQSARKGPWEEYARDRCRFSNRIRQVEAIVSPCLQPEHRQTVRNNLPKIS